LRFQPRNVLAEVGLARSLGLLAQAGEPGRFAEAERWWRRAAAHDPHDWEERHGYGLLLNSWANAEHGDPRLRRRAAEELRRALALKPDSGPTLVPLGRLQLSLGDRTGAVATYRRILRLDPGN